MSSFRFLYPLRIALLLALGGIVGPPLAAVAEELPPAVQLEHDLIEGTHQENLKKATQPLAELGTKYAAALEKRKAAVQAAGNLDGVMVVDVAIKDFAAGKPPKAESSDPELAKLAKLYSEEHEKLEASLRPALVEAWTLHRRKLEAFVTRLTKEGKIDAAKTIRDEVAGVDKTLAGLGAKGSPKDMSPKELLLSTTWMINPKRAGAEPWQVKFLENGTATRVSDGAKIWKWKIEEGGVLWCHWLSSGWIKFEIADTAAFKFTGVSKGGDNYTMSAAK